MKIGIVDAGGGLRDSRMEYCVVAADAETGKARYFGKEDIGQDNYDVLKASSSMPFVCRLDPVQGRLYFDGALGDPVPVEKAFSLGCDYVVVLLTKPEGVPCNPPGTKGWPPGYSTGTPLRLTRSDSAPRATTPACTRRRGTP